MELPFRRDALAERAALDRADELDAAALESPEDRVLLVLELAELLRDIGEASEAPWAVDPANDLADKARRLARPIRLLVGP